MIPIKKIENKKDEWLIKRFFFDGLPKEENKPYYRVIYRELLKEQLNAFIKKENYEFDMESDGFLKIRMDFDFDTYEFTFIEKNEDNEEKSLEYSLLNSKEYFNVLELMTSKYLNNYFCLLGEKETFSILIKQARELI